MIPKAQLDIEGIVFGVVHLSNGHLSHTTAVELLADKQDNSAVLKQEKNIDHDLILKNSRMTQHLASSARGNYQRISIFREFRAVSERAHFFFHV